MSLYWCLPCSTLGSYEPSCTCTSVCPALLPSRVRELHSLSTGKSKELPGQLCMLVLLLRWVTQAQPGPDLAALVSAGITCPRSSALLLTLPNALVSCWLSCPHLEPFSFSVMEEITAQSLNCRGLPHEAHTAGGYTMCS